MKKLITIIAVSLLTINAQAQYGGVIRAVNNSNVIGEIQRIGASMKVHDTALVNIQTAMKLKTDSIYTRLGSGVGVSSIPSATQDVLDNIYASTSSTDAQMNSLVNIQTAMKLKTDSIYRRMYQDSVNLAKLGTGVTITGSVNSTISGVTKKILSTQVVSADTGLVVNAVMHGLTTGIGSGYVDVKVNPSGALTVEATLDSTTQRGTMKISNFPATQAVSGTIAATQSGTWNINNVSGTVSLPTGAATSALQTTGNTALELMDDVVNTNGAVHGTRSFLVAGSDGARARALLTNTSGNLETKAWSVDSAIFASINSKLGGTLTVGTHAVTNAGTFAVQAAQSGTWNINNVSGTVSLPTGAATESTSYNIYGEMLDQSNNYLQPSKLKLDSIYTRLGTGVTVNSHPVTNAGTFPVQVDSSTQRRGVVIIGGSITATAGATGQYDSTWAVVNMDTAGLAAKASSATVGWQSDSVGIRQHKATDVEIGVRISMANTTPANDKAVYIYICPWWYNGSTWYSASGGTTTMPSGANSTYTIATPNNLRLLGVLSYTTQNMVLQDVFTLSSVFTRMPDAFSIVVVNFSGAAVHTSGNEITYNLMNKVQR